MRWQKLGRIFDPTALDGFGLNSALMPSAEVINESLGTVRVYFSPRDQWNRSEVRSFDFSVFSPEKILKISNRALLSRGKLGTFDDSGVTLGSIVNTDDEKLLFYTGWNRTLTVPFNNSIGVAEFSSDGLLVRRGDGPIMTRTLFEPYSCASPFVLRESGIFKMWYASMDRWQEMAGRKPVHHYNIKFAQSSDGIIWERDGHVSIDYAEPAEYAFGRPFVLHEDGIYKMWYSFRGDRYRIGYAESCDGKNWERLDQLAGINRSLRGWDSEMIEYPFIFDCAGSRFMLYNGNGYGRSGIGLAKCID